MTKKCIFRSFLRALCLLSALFWLGCQNSSQGPRPVTGPQSAPEGPLESGGMGTTDGGGGNGAGSKVYESYIVNPLKLEAYKKHLEPIFMKMRMPQESDASFIEGFALTKTWYIAPVKINPLDKETLGLAFSEDQTQQLARQTSQEIWIDSGYFDKMTSEEQAKLILHEIVMATYFIKYKKMSAICRMMRTATSKHECDERVDEVFLEVKEAPLKARDYTNIRNMTGILWNQGKSSSVETLYTQFLKNDFDSRIFDAYFSSSEPTDDKSHEVPLQNVLDVFEASLLLNKAPNLCTGLITKIEKPCKLSAGPQDLLYMGHKLPGLGFSAKSPEGQELVKGFIHNQGSAYFSFAKDLAAKKNYYVFPLVHSQIAKKGEKYNWVFVFVNGFSPTAKSDFEIQALVSFPGIITKVTKDKDGNTVCHGDRPEPTGFSDDIIAITKAGVDTTYFRWFGKYVRGTTVPCY